MTSVNDQFTDISVNYDLIGPIRFAINQIALGFINAMKLQALEDYNQHITNYAFVDTEYADDPIRIRVKGAADGPEGQLVRCNILYAIKTLGIDLIIQERLYGAKFYVSYNGQLLYTGIFDNKNDVALLEPSSNSSGDLSEVLVQKKRALSTRSLNTGNSSSTLLSIPGSDDVEYRVDFAFRGIVVSRASIFSAILEFMLILAQRDSTDSIEAVSQSTPTDLLWIFAKHRASSDFHFQGFQLLAILESIARHVVDRRHYAEITFEFYINDTLVAAGCVTKPLVSRRWCNGLV